MDWLSEVVDRLAGVRTWGYHQDAHTASEPLALSALALLAHGRNDAARPCLDLLHRLQADDGGVSVMPGESGPGWPTAWAVLAWHAETGGASPQPRKAESIERGVAWLLSRAGAVIERGDWKGHDTTLRGWPWVEGTHSWLEPTAISVLALRESGHGQHPRTTEAYRMLADRLLEHGGCNYGNTVVFGQELRAHLQPTGLCLLALAGKAPHQPRIERSIEYLRQSLSGGVGTSSLCYGLLGLAAWNQLPADAPAWLESVAQRTLRRDAAPYRLALLALAGLGAQCPLIPERQLVHSAAFDSVIR